MRLLGPVSPHHRRALTAGAAALALTLTTSGHAGAAATPDTELLRGAVKLDALLVHTRALQQIADATGGDRAAGGPGDRRRGRQCPRG